MARKMIDLENRTRDVYYLPFVRRVERAGGLPPVNLIDRGRTLVIGDAADAVLPPGVARSKLCPDPVVRISADDFAALGKANLAFLNGAIAAGHIRKREYTE